MCCFSRRLLLIAYPTGLQMRDCADLSALREVFDLDLGAAEWALMLGCAETDRQKVRVVQARPLLGILCVLFRHLRYVLVTVDVT